MIPIEELYKIFLEHPQVSTDSRKISPGSLFFALKGDNFDGNSYAPDAIRNGASFAIIDNKEFSSGASFILVDDVLKTLQELALYHRKQLNIPVIAITGTNGKTTTKELIETVLSQKYRTTATKGNLNNHIGVPLTLLSLTPETQIAVIEMGANHVGEIESLCRIAMPTHGIITNIGKAHLEGFGGFDGVIKAKTELFRFLQSVSGIAFINKGNALLMQHSTGLKTITYGSVQTAEFSGSLMASADPFIKVRIFFRSSILEIGSKLYGSYNFENILAAACIGDHFNVGPEEIKTGIESYEPSNNRSQVVKTGKNTLILDAYNANPDSLKRAIQSFAGSSFQGKTVIIGDMLELGQESDEEHRNILELIEKAGFTYVFLIGPVFTRLNTKREWICLHDSELARIWFEHHRMEGKTILIKGSRGIRLEKITDTL